MKLLKHLLPLFAAILCLSLAAGPTQGSSIDGVPLLSQVKSFFQWLSGDANGANQTQENFLNQAPIVAQVKSLVQAILGDTQGAQQTQKVFASNIGDVAESTPVIGHMIGLGQILSGENERGLDTFKRASSNSGAALGVILAGPYGAVAGRLVADGIITFAESVKSSEYRAFGVIGTVRRIDERNPSNETKPSGMSRNKKTAKGKKGKESGKDKDKDKKDDGKKEEELIESVKDQMSSIEDKMNEMISEFYEDVDRVETLSKWQRLEYLQELVDHVTEEHRRRLEDLDFHDVDAFGEQEDCPLCSLAGFMGESVDNLARHMGDDSNGSDFHEVKLYDPAHMVELYKRNGFPHAQSSQVFKTEEALLQDLRKRVVAVSTLGETSYKFLYQFSHPKGSHIVAAKAWFCANGWLKTMTTDFQVPPKPSNLTNRFYAWVNGNTTNTPNRWDFVIYDMYGENLLADSPDTSVDHFGHHNGHNAKRFNAQQMQLARTRSSSLPDCLKAKLSSANFLKVKDTQPDRRGSWTLLAAMLATTLSELQKNQRMEYKDVDGVNTFDEVISMYRELGFPETVASFRGTKEELMTFIENKVKPGRETDFALAYETDAGPPGGVYVVWVKAWRREGKGLDMLITDFEFDQLDSRRFSRSLDSLEGSNGKMFHIITPLMVEVINATDVKESRDRLDQVVLDQGSGCKSKRIVGYVPSWSRTLLTIDQASRFTNLIYAYAEVDANASLRLPGTELDKQRLMDSYLARETIKLRGQDLKLSFAIGGVANSQHFSNITRDTDLRTRFVESIKRMMDYYAFDGVDIDWEYPVTGGAIEGRPEDRANYVTFLEELRLAIGPLKLISIAAAAGEDALRGFDVENIVKHVDWINVMTYDFNGAWGSDWGIYTGHNAPLFHSSPPGFSGKLNVNWAIKQYVCRSQDPSKIVLGLPFYGRYWHRTTNGKDPGHYKLYRFARRVDGKYGGEESFRLIQELWNTSSSGYEFYWDDKAQAPWALHPQKTSVLSFDNPQSIRAKIAFALEHNLGGVVVKSLSDDDDNLTLTRELSHACAPTGDTVNYQCNPLAKRTRLYPIRPEDKFKMERRWWTWADGEDKVGQCGKSAPLYDGYYPVCDPDDQGFGCCGDSGYCGSGPKFCDCPTCIDYTKDPARVTAEPAGPTRSKIQWHAGFSDKLKPGAPRCGPNAPTINGSYAICNPDDDFKYCCSPGGHCGSGPGYCDCPGCKDYRKIPEKDAIVKAGKASIR